VDAFEPRAIQESAGVAAEQHAVGRELRHRPPAALGNRLGAVGDGLAAGEQRAHERVGLEPLQVTVRVAGGIARVQAGDESDRPVRVVDAVDERAAERLGRERPVHRVDHAAFLHAARWHLPEFLHAGRVHLRILADRKPEGRVELLRERAARTLAQHGRLGVADRTGLIVGFLLAVLVDALVADLHTQNSSAFDQRLRGRHLGRDQPFLCLCVDRRDQTGE
jgi:hypothetical protein